MNLPMIASALVLAFVGIGAPSSSAAAVEPAAPARVQPADKEKSKEKNGKEAAAEAAWVTDHKAALATAKKDKKVVLMDFTGSDWCGWCIKLKREVFDTTEFKEWAAKNVVLLELDFPRKKELPADLVRQNENLRDKFGIQGYPTILLVDAKGKKIGQLGYVEGGPAAWIVEAEKVLKKK